MPHIAKNLRTLRLQSDKKQDELAELLGISQQEYSKFERDIAKPNLKHIEKLATFYRISVDHLLRSSLHEHPSKNYNYDHTLTTKERELYEKLLEAKDAHIRALEALSALKLPKDPS